MTATWPTALDNIPERIKRVPPVDPYLLERVLDGLRALPSSPAPYRSRPGFLSSLLHAVPTGGDEWSTCTRPSDGRRAALQR
ncbi:MAG: hypothetical protein GEV28_03390 [Actinophytocola sp.]|uniref:hypothetical protein n=1 Tax=Actinophytocola sp. TaxID=1872138 RepID=UPI0013263B85|nr:hypothetical protein [Actinophytocola sp.]MPZ79478.1 hypothetical protein [Actinophytocola sp.]